VDQIGLVQENKTDQSDLVYISQMFVEQNMSAYPNLAAQSENIFKEIEMEEEKFRKTLVNGLKEFEKIITAYINNNISVKVLPGDVAFNLYTTFGFPIELILEIAKEKGLEVNLESFKSYMKKHQEISKAGSEQKFKGGLASTGEQETKYHTATHLLLGALRKVLNAEIVQKGSNITAERMRFDFNWPEKLTPEQLKKVEDLVNEKIAEKIPVEMFELPKEEAKKICTVLSFDLSKYGDIVKVYKVGNFDVEFCGGPHVKNTSELGHFKIVKEEASSAGVRRIKAILE
jgi:alanyl-tRNA synthetase